MEMRLLILRKQVLMMTHHIPAIDKDYVAEEGFRGEHAVILGDPYAKKCPLPHIGVTSHLSVSPSIP
jgi:hypothetical protein